MFRRIVAALCASFFFINSSLAVTNTPVYVQTPNIGAQTFIQGTDTAGTFKTIYTGGTNGSKCVGLMAASNDTVAHVLTVRITHSSTAIPMVGPTITGAANYASGGLNLMQSQNWPGLPIDSDGNPFFYLASGDVLAATFATALTSTDQINFMAVCADF